MQTLERYILRQILGPLGFFMLVLTGIIWLSQSLQVIDIVVSNGQGAQVLLELAALRLPFALSIVLPFAATMATVYALNRMISESEIIAALAGGASRARLARPIVALGVGLVLVLSFVTLYLMPSSAQSFRNRIAEVRADLAGGLIREGRFLFPTDGVTVFVGEVTSDGQMVDLLLHDARTVEGEPEQTPTTFLASRAQIVPRRGEGEDAQGPFLAMADVEAQRLLQQSTGAQSLQQFGFEQFFFDMTDLIDADGGRLRKPSEYYFYELIDPSPEDAPTERDVGRFVSEGHEQLSAPLYGLAMPLAAAAAMFAAAFSRRGMGRAVAAALAVAMAARLVGFAAKNAVSATPELWPLMYLAPLGVIAASAYFLTRSGFRAGSSSGPTRLGPAAPSTDPRTAGAPARQGRPRAALPAPRRPQRRGP